MSYLRRWFDRLNAAFVDDALVAYDLTWMMVYLRAGSAGHPDRKALIEAASRQPLRSAGPFRRVFALVDRLGFDHTAAIQQTAVTAHPESVKNVLSRFSGAVSAGAPASEHFEREHAAVAVGYRARYEQELENLNQWTGGFAASTVSAVLMLSVVMVMSLVFEVSNQLLGQAASVLVAGLIIGAHSVGRSAPTERVVLADDSLKWMRYARLSMALVPIGVAWGYKLRPEYGVGGMLALAGLSLLPAGVLALVADRSVREADRYLPALVRRLGELCDSLGMTVSSAAVKVELTVSGKLQAPLVRLRQRLSYGLDEEASWQQFSRESGSDLVARATQVFRDAVRLGARPLEAAAVSSDHAEMMNNLRTRRQATVNPFISLVLTLHGLLVAVLMIMLETTAFFTAQFELLTTEVRTNFPANPLGFVPSLMVRTPDIISYRNFSLILIIVMALTIAWACYMVRGGPDLTFCLYLGLALLIAGALMVVMPPLMGRLFDFTVAGSGSSP